MSSIMQETDTRSTTLISGPPQHDFSQDYSMGQLEELGSIELLDGYAE